MTPQELSDYSWGAPAPTSKKEITLNTLLERIATSNKTASGEVVTPESCMSSPTVRAIVTAISNRISVSPVQVFKREMDGDRERRVRMFDHPLERLMRRPNQFQNRNSYWLDATSTLIRHGKFIAHKSQGMTGPVRLLTPLNPSAVRVKQDPESMDLSFVTSLMGGGERTFQSREIHYVRSGARNFYDGDSPIHDVREAISIEIAVEKYGASFFGNGALPLAFFSFLEGHNGFRTTEEEEQFIESFQNAFSGGNRFRGMLVPKGLEATLQSTDQEKTQMNETRKQARSIIAGAFGVPPHLVGDLERATFNNVEQQDKDFTINVVLPYAQMFEAALEHDFLTPEQMRQGYIVRMNLDAVQRADFKTRQEGLEIQRRNGIINPNDWREREYMNPISEDDGGETYLTMMNMTSQEERNQEPAQPVEQPTEGENQ